MLRKYFGWFLVFFISTMMQATYVPFHLLNYATSNDSVVVVKVFENFKSRVALIKYGFKRFALVKQSKIMTINRQISRVREVLSSYIAESIDIPVNRVRLIPFRVLFPGKIFNMCAGTLHSYVPGVPYPKVNQFKKLYLKQPLKANLALEKRGFTRNIIRHMSNHEDLPAIVALDTFVGNVDRSKRNLFYDRLTDRFWGIDLEQTFKLLLSEQTFEYFNSLLEKSDLDFSNKELKALRRYRKVLIELMQKNSTERQVKIFKDLLYKVKGSFEKYKNYSDRRIEIILEQHKSWIEQNYEYVSKIVDIVKKLTKKA